MNSYHQPIKRVRKVGKTPTYLAKFERTWLRHAEREMAENTVIQRLVCVKKFDSWLDQNPRFKTRFSSEWPSVCQKGRILFVEDNDLRNFFTYLHSLNRSVKTRRAYRESIKEFFNYAQAMGLMHTVPSWSRIFIRKTEAERQKEQKTPLTFEDVQRIREYLKRQHEDSNCDLQNMALLELLAGTGARVNEILQIRIDKLDLDCGEVQIFGQKTSQTRDGWRTVPLQKSSCDIILDYMEARNPESEVLFPSLRDYDVRNLVIRWRKALGIPDLSPHAFRHYAITRLCQAENGNGRIYDINEISQMVGCEPSTIIQYYYHPSVSKIVETFHKNEVAL